MFTGKTFWTVVGIAVSHHFYPTAFTGKILPGAFKLFTHVRVGRIELPSHAWEARVLPLNHTRPTTLRLKEPIPKRLFTRRY